MPLQSCSTTEAILSKYHCAILQGKQRSSNTLSDSEKAYRTLGKWKKQTAARQREDKGTEFHP